MAGAQISAGANVLIALISAALGGLSMAAGRLATGALTARAARTSGAALMGIIGLSMSLKAFLDGFAPPEGEPLREICNLKLTSLGLVLRILKEPLRADHDGSGTIDLREGLLLGFALALNNVANGIPAGLMGLPILFTSLCMGLLSLVFVGLGWRLGRIAKNRMVSHRAGIIAGIILICLAIITVI